MVCACSPYNFVYLLHQPTKLSAAATASAAWVKGKTAAALSKVGSARREAPVTGYPPSFNSLTSTSTADAAAAAFQSGAHGSGFLGSGTVPDPNGIPVKVSVHRKSVREFADLRLVQEVQAHTGVVWAMKFSRNGRYLATAGQDGVIRVWEAVPNRGAGGGLSGSGTPLQPGTPTKAGASLVAAALNGAAAPESDAAAGWW
jgi:WD40 repeat protein